MYVCLCLSVCQSVRPEINVVGLFTHLQARSSVITDVKKIISVCCCSVLFVCCFGWLFSVGWLVGWMVGSLVLLLLFWHTKRAKDQHKRPGRRTDEILPQRRSTCSMDQNEN